MDVDVFLAPFSNTFVLVKEISPAAVNWLSDHGFDIADAEPLVLPKAGLQNVIRAMQTDGLVVAFAGVENPLERMYNLPSREVAR
jgi:hypothetical protein